MEFPVGKEEFARNKVPEFRQMESTLSVRGFLSSIWQLSVRFTNNYYRIK